MHIQIIKLEKMEKNIRTQFLAEQTWEIWMVPVVPAVIALSQAWLSQAFPAILKSAAILKS